MQDWTPKAMRCEDGWCPSVHELDDGRLLIVGDRAAQQWHQQENGEWERRAAQGGGALANHEEAVIISPDLLSDYVAGKVREERAAWREVMKALGPWLRQAKEDGDLDALIEGNVWPEPLCVISEADVQKSIEIAKRIRPQVEARAALDASAPAGQEAA